MRSVWREKEPRERGIQLLRVATRLLFGPVEVQGAALGVLKLTLQADSYQWQFIPVSGRSFSDSGRGTCHAR
jgi:hypothetical protein